MHQYVGKTVDEFRLRWNSYKMNNRNFLNGQTLMQQHLLEHFASEGHCSLLEDVTIYPSISLSIYLSIYIYIYICYIYNIYIIYILYMYHLYYIYTYIY